MEFEDEGSVPVTPDAKNTVEHWATVKGMLPQRFPGKVLKPTVPTPGMRAIPVNLAAYAEHGPRDNPAHVAFAAAKAGNRWPEGAELTEAEFDKAVSDAYGPKSTVICR